MLEKLPARLPGLALLRPRVLHDDRGFFSETWRQDQLGALLGEPLHFVQDNHSRSARGVLRGLHWQADPPQGKLVRVARGRVYDVAVDLRPESPTFGQWEGFVLDDADALQLWIPPGFAHGFLVLSEVADLLYKTTAPYHAPGDRSLAWDDPALAIEWPLEEIGGSPRLSARDAAAPAWEAVRAELNGSRARG